MQNRFSLYLRNRFFAALIGLALLFVASYWWSLLWVPAMVAFWLLVGLLLLDVALLYRTSKGIFARRVCAERFSNGDENPVDIYVENRYPYPVSLQVIDELPVQFQKRDSLFELSLKSGETKTINYTLIPRKRGEYNFGAVNVFAISTIGFISRRYRFDADTTIPVYPSYIQMRKYELLAISNTLTMAGIKKIRRIGNNKEFEQIGKYVSGDDYRRINWKATARKRSLMINHYQDERSQNVYSVIDKGRVMKMPFEGMTLLDYAINASLVISNIAIKKGDKAGLITFQDKINAIVPASSRTRQMKFIMEQFYKEKTNYRESDFARLYATLRHKLNQRSLVIIYTNFESIHSLERQMKYLKLINRQHLVLCVFFENTEVHKLTHTRANGLEEIYIKGIAEQLMYEKRLIVKELQAHGIQTVLTRPQDLSVNTINKYLELKTRGLI